MRKINLSEAKISNIIRGVINEMFDEAAIAYDKNFLDGIDSIDARSINYFIQAMIPEGNRVSVNSPYKSIRQLVLYFSPNGAAKHGGRLTKDIVNYILKDDALRAKIYEISQCDKKIIDLVYGTNKLSGKPLMQKIVWNLDSMLKSLSEFNELVNNSNIKNYFSGTEAINGSSDGKRVGLSTIMFRAFMGIDEIKKQIKKMQDILDKGNDAFSYNTRKCFIREISKKESKLFLEKNHIQGYSRSSVNIGSFYDEKLIGVASFIRIGNDYILNRLATDINYICSGVCSKLISYFEKNYQYNNIVTFADKRWVGEQNIYLTLGFEKDKEIKPSYTYRQGNKVERIHKFNLRKQILHKKYNLPLYMTEEEMTKMLKFYKIYDCGLIKYKKARFN